MNPMDMVFATCLMLSRRRRHWHKRDRKISLRELVSCCRPLTWLSGRAICCRCNRGIQGHEKEDIGHKESVFRGTVEAFDGRALGGWRSLLHGWLQAGTHIQHHGFVLSRVADLPVCGCDPGSCGKSVVGPLSTGPTDCLADSGLSLPCVVFCLCALAYFLPIARR
jgi:hypothetical protein